MPAIDGEWLTASVVHVVVRDVDPGERPPTSGGLKRNRQCQATKFTYFPPPPKDSSPRHHLQSTPFSPHATIAYPEVLVVNIITREI
jgi:hypothetical protein